MKRLIALLLSCALIITSCGQSTAVQTITTAAPATIDSTSESTSVSAAESVETVEAMIAEAGEEVVEFESLNDAELLSYLEDEIYVDLENQFSSDDYIIENINAIYISQEYLEEVAYNSQSNIWFGYTMSELEEQFDGTPYVFTIADDGSTEVVPFEDYDDTYDRVIKNVAIGTGVILVCVTVSVISGGLGAAPISMIFAASAKTGTAMALSSSVISGAMAGTITGVQTGDFDQAIKAAALKGSDGFKWGAISGAIIGGVSKASALRSAAKDVASGKSATIAEKARAAEQRASKKFGGMDQKTYLNGKEVAYGTPGGTRPDVTRQVGNNLEAIEVKYYNLSSKTNVNSLCTTLKKQVTDRIANMPDGTTQRIVLDVTERGFSKTVVYNARETIQKALMDIYPNIPIDIIGL